MILDDFRLLISFFRSHGLDPSLVIPHLHRNEKDEYLAMAEDWQKEEEAFKNQQVRDIPETEEDKRARLELDKQEYEDLLMHSAGR